MVFGLSLGSTRRYCVHKLIAGALLGLSRVAFRLMTRGPRNVVVAPHCSYILCNVQRLYKHSGPDASAKVRIGEVPALRDRVSHLVTEMLRTTRGDAGFVAVVHDIVREMSSVSGELSVGIHRLPAFPVEPQLLGDSAARSVGRPLTQLAGMLRTLAVFCFSRRCHDALRAVAAHSCALCRGGVGGFTVQELELHDGSPGYRGRAASCGCALILSACFSFSWWRLSDVFRSFLCGSLAGIDAGSLPLTSDGLSDSKSRGRSRVSGAGAGAGSGGPAVSTAYASPEEVVHAWSELAKLYGFIGDEEVRVRNQYERV